MAKAPPVKQPAKGQSGSIPVHASAKNEAREMQLLVTPDGLAAYLNVIFHSGQPALTGEEVLKFLEEQALKLTDECRAAVAKAVCEIPKAAGVLGPVLLSKGKAAALGLEGRVEWLIPPPQVLREKKRTGGRVDYREYNQIVNVQQGQKILTLISPGSGEAGEDVFGQKAEGQPGKPASMKKGKNVEVTTDGKGFFAQVSGMLQVSADTVSVEPNMIVPNDVDMSVGNIDFLGPVKVGKDVRDGFHIRAGKEIEIGGMVEGAGLESGSYIKIQGGVAGRGKARIICKGNLDAKYLNEVCVEAGGDVVIANSITNSTVKSLGKIIVTNGGIRGANVVAQKGLKTPELGSEFGVRTIAIVGVDYHLKDKFVDLERELAAIREAVEKVEGALGPLLTDGEIMAMLPPEKAEIARRLMGQLDLLVKRGDDLAAKRDAMVARMQVGPDVFIEVTKKIYSGVVMQIGLCKRTFELEISGPVKLLPDIENASIRVSR
jgi:hypothetical protein